jgi:hypothetical protein
MPKMATSVTSAGLKAAADKVILASRPAVEELKLFSVNLSVDPSKKGNGVVVEVVSAVAGDFGASNGYTKASGTIKPATVILDQHKKSSFTVSDRDALENELAPCWGTFGPAAGKAVARAAVQYAIGKLDFGNAKAVATAAYETISDFAGIRGIAEENGLDPADCVLVLTPAAYAKALAATPAHVLGDNAAIRAGVLGQFLGFKAVIDAPNASKTSADGVQKGFGFIVPTGALAVAARVVVPVKEGGNLIEFGTVQDDETGFAMGMRVVVDADQGECTWTVDALFGAALTYNATTNPNAPRYVQLAVK